MATSVFLEPDTLPMLITVTHQCKEQEQGRENEGCERVGHHGGGPLLRLSEQVLTREDTPGSFRMRSSQQGLPVYQGPNANYHGEEIPPRG